MPIRLATTADLNDILYLGRDSFDRVDRPDAKWLVEILAQPTVKVMVDAIGPGTLRGFLISTEYQGCVQVRMIAVGAGYRRMGVAQELLKTVKGEASAWIREENTASRRLFKSAGFKMASRFADGGGKWCFYHRSRSRP